MPSMWFRRLCAASNRPACACLALAAALCALPGGLRAEPPLRLTPDNPAPELSKEAKEKAAREADLARVRADQRRAAEIEARLAAELEEIGQDRRRLSQTLVQAATRLRDVEERIAASEKRVAALDATEGGIRKGLEDRKAVIAELLAAMQRMGHRAPPAVLLRPADALRSVRTAILLGAVLPGMRSEAEALAGELTALVRVRGEIAAEHETLARDHARLSDDQTRMALLVEERQKRQGEAERALETERQRTAVLARQADNLKDLIARLEGEGAGLRGTAPGDRAASTASLAMPGGRTANAPAREAQRLGPAVAFASTRGALPMPVSGVKIRDFGGTDGIGGSQKGLSIATRPAAPVTSPCDGWVVYAGPFRSYGQLLILNAGGGYHVLLAGMERVSVDLGQFVLTGEPVAAMGGGGPRLGSAGTTQPVLYVEFRKDGTPIDPGPWWAVTDSEKARG